MQNSPIPMVTCGPPFLYLVFAYDTPICCELSRLARNATPGGRYMSVSRPIETYMLKEKRGYMSLTQINVTCKFKCSLLNCPDFLYYVGLATSQNRIRRTGLYA